MLEVDILGQWLLPEHPKIIVTNLPITADPFYLTTLTLE
jgi:hypothetical protein